MKKILLLLFLSFLCYTHSVFAQTPIWAWAQAGITNQGFVAQTGIGVDAAGNTYITGYGYTINGMIFGNTTLPPLGMFLAKYNANGKLVWAKHISEGCQPGALYTDPKGSIYVTGRIMDTVTVGATTLICQGHSDIFVMKFDSAGTAVWAKKAGGPGRHPQTPPPILSEDEGTSIAADTAGNVYVSGFYFATQNSTANFDSISFSIPPNSPINQELGFLAKYNAAGQIQWVRKAEGYSGWAVYKIATTDQGNCYVTGVLQGSISYGPNGATLTSNGSDDICYAKYDTNGNLMWAKSFGGPDMDNSKAIAANKQGECFLSGSFRSTNLPIGNYSLSGSSQRATTYVAKCDSSGNIIWATQTTGTPVPSETRTWR